MTIWMFIIYLACFITWTSALTIPPHFTPHPSSHVAFNDRLSRRTIFRPPDGPIQQSFNFNHVLPARHVLLGNGSGFTITCINCKLEGEFHLELDFGIDDAIVAQIPALASSAAAVVSTISSEASSITVAVASEVTSFGVSVIAGASSVVAEASSVIADSVASIAPVAQSIASGAEGFLTSILPNIFGSYQADPARRDLPDLLASLKDFKISLTHVAPVTTDFTLEFSTGDNPVQVDLGVPAPIPGIVPFGPPTVPIGPINLGLVMSPLALTFSATLQSNMNVTIPFGADVAFGRPLIISNEGLIDPIPNITIRSGSPVLNQVDPNLCISATLGPAIKATFEIPGTGVGIDFNAHFQLPQISLCLRETNDFDVQCQLRGNSTNGLKVNSTLSIGVGPNIQLVLPAGLDKLVPSVPKISPLQKSFPIIDECVDLANDKGLLRTLPVTISSDIVSTEVSAELVTSGIALVTSTPSFVAMTISSQPVTNRPLQSATVSESSLTVVSSTTKVVTLTVTATSSIKT